MYFFFSLGRVRYPNFFINGRFYVKTKNIKFISSVELKPNRGCPFFLSETWFDSIKISTLSSVFRNNYKYNSAKEIIINKTDPNNTLEAIHIKDIIGTKGSYRGFSNAYEYMNSVHDIYKSIMKNGYKKRNSLFSKFYGEIEALIDEEGNVIKINSGNHRFAAAYLLDIEYIPVHICAIHSKHKPKNIFMLNNKIKTLISKNDC